MTVKWDVSKLEEAVKQSYCYADVCRIVGLDIKGRNYDTIKRHIALLKLDISHFKSRSELTKERSFKNVIQIPDNEFFVVGHRRRRQVKKLLSKYKSYECEECKLSGSWCNKPLVLHLDHINGNSLDHTLDNLRFLCPNCHSQTITYAGKSSRLKPSQVDPNWRTREKLSKRKVDWPTKDELKSLLDTKTFVAIGQMFSVSDTAVRKWAKKYKLI